MNKNSNIGATLITLQQQLNHQKNLQSIYRNTSQKKYFTVNEALKYSHSHHMSSKSQQYEEQQHLKNVRRLFDSLNRSKTMLDRLKDPFDFYVFPAYFFRQVSVNNSKANKQSKTKLKKVKSQAHFNSNSQKISIQKIRQYLPYLHTFDRQQLEQFADGLNKLIITFNIVNRDELNVLYQKVVSILPKECPSTFRIAVQMMMQEVGQQLSR